MHISAPISIVVFALVMTLKRAVALKYSKQGHRFCIPLYGRLYGFISDTSNVTGQTRKTDKPHVLKNKRRCQRKQKYYLRKVFCRTVWLFRPHKRVKSSAILPKHLSCSLLQRRLHCPFFCHYQFNWRQYGIGLVGTVPNLVNASWLWTAE